MDRGSDSEHSDAQSDPGEIQLIQPNGNNSDSEDGNEPEIEIYEEDNIPHPKDYTDLAQWLKLSDAHLAALHTSVAPLQLKETPSQQPSQIKSAGHDTSVSSGHIDVDPQSEWLVEECRLHSKELTLDLANISDVAEPEIDPPAKLSASPSTSRVTVEDVEDDDNDYLTIEPCQLSPEALAEEGLDQLPWDPSEDITPHALDAPTPVEQPLPPNPPVFPPLQSLPPGSATYFIMHKVLHHQIAPSAGKCQLHCHRTCRWTQQSKISRADYKHARALLKAGKTREGYQTTQSIIDQSTQAMDILNEDYPNEKHTLAYDNATIHIARALAALSAIAMMLKPSGNFNKIKGPDNVNSAVPLFL
ncbi:hypothetical protein B0H17DRAFT_1134692 [Mycena rosella]|uniref:Uncharacterized protein n=1 Tax=Mycena rosella TaxID=1033263 RepID=A0AAD7DFK6_MYCRO|nr:hypothetical protein B0H17DRAFT_1134692 [Mycena rosella]